jgi:hypothetical protein
MAINVSFNGSTIYKPGSYSKRSIDLGGGFPLSPTGLVALFGEATAGQPGAGGFSSIADNVFTADQLPVIKQIYRSGPIVDACSFLFAPGADGAIPSGAQAVYIYKTNASALSALTLANSWGVVNAREYGTGGNRITLSNTLVPATSATVTSTGTFDLTGGALNGNTMLVRVNGEGSDHTFTVPSATTTRALLTTALANSANWGGSLPSGMVFTVGGAADNAATLTVARASTGTPNREGFGRCFALVSGTLLGSGAGKVGITAGLYTSTTEDQAILSVNNTRDLITETATIGGTVVLKVGRLGGVAPAVTINATQLLLINNSVTEYALNLADFSTVSQVVDFISNSTAGTWSASLSSVLVGQLSPTVLDRVTAVGANATSLSSSALPALITKDASEVADFFAQSSNVGLTGGAGSFCGLPDALVTAYLTGGTVGATHTAAITNALTAFQRVRVNAVVPLFSRDSAADIADQSHGCWPQATPSLGIHQAVKSHCSLMATTKARSERQGYLSAKDTYANCKVLAQTLADAVSSSSSRMSSRMIAMVTSSGSSPGLLPVC